MQALLICGGTKEERLAKAQQKAEGVKKEDLIFLSSETSLGIEEIRQLEKRLSLKPYSSPKKPEISPHPGGGQVAERAFKACVIENAQVLTVPAQNALLKTLEEPPKNTLLVLTAPTPESLLPTIVSRCQILKLPAKTEIYLKEEELEDYILMFKTQLSPQLTKRLKLAGVVGRTRQDSLDFLTKQTLLWRKFLLQKIQVPASSTAGQNLPGDKFKLEGVGFNLTMKQIAAILHQLQKTKQMIKGNVNPKLAIEVFFLDLPGLKV